MSLFSFIFFKKTEFLIKPTYELNNAIYINKSYISLNVMSNSKPLEKVEELKQVLNWMLDTLSAYEKGLLDKKTTANIAKKTKRKVEKYIPKENEKEYFENVLDLCLSLSTIDRAQGNFEKFYLESLREDLEKITKALG